MITLINTNRIDPPIAPIGLDYLLAVLDQHHIPTTFLDLNRSSDLQTDLESHFRRHQPVLVGLSFRNCDDCFWPSATSFVPQLTEITRIIRQSTYAPIVLGGVGYTLFPLRLLQHTGADFGIVADPETTLPALYHALRTDQNLSAVPNLIWRRPDQIIRNPLRLVDTLSLPVSRHHLDNSWYFQHGGQIGLETKRGCFRSCLYCPEPSIRGRHVRCRPPADVADEAEHLLRQGIDVLHLCDSEFNLPLDHARAVCAEFIRRRLGDRLRWYAYMSITPFDAAFASDLRRAGCVGIDFTTDAAHPAMLQTYRQPHTLPDIQNTVRLCRQNNMTVMCDMLIGGPGETPDTLDATIADFKRLDIDCAGAALGLRIYPDTPMAAYVDQTPPETLAPHLRRRYSGPLDLLWPTFYLSAHLGSRPSALVTELIADDTRFFPPAPDDPDSASHQDHNYSDNSRLKQALAAGHRGAYWHILHRLKQTDAPST